MLSPGGPEDDSPDQEKSGTPEIQLKTHCSRRRKDALVSDVFVFLILAFSGRLCGVKDVSCPSSGVRFQPNRRNRAPARQRQMDEKLCEASVLALKHNVRGFNPKGV